jgi:hypothetical protein
VFDARARARDARTGCIDRVDPREQRVAKANLELAREVSA